MPRSAAPDRLFVRTIAGNLATVAARINDVAPLLVPHLVSMQQFDRLGWEEHSGATTTTVVFAIASDGGYEGKVWRTSYDWATQLIDRL